MAGRRSNGEGSFSKKTISGIEYHRYRKHYDGMDKPKEFYAKTMKELKLKIKDFEDNDKPKTSDDVSKQTFFDYINWWLTTQKKSTLKEGTYLDSQDLIKYYIKDFKDVDISNKQMGQLNDTLFQRHIDAMAKYYARGTILRIYALITPCLKYAKKKKHIMEDIWEDYHMPSEENVAHKKKDAIYLQREDMIKLFNEASRINQRGNSFGKIGAPTYGNNAYVLILIMGGAFRKGEVLDLRWRDIDFNKRIISINSSTRSVRNIEDDTSKYRMIESSPKTPDSVRIIPMTHESEWALNKLSEANPNHKDDDCVCLNKDGRLIQERNLRRTLQNMLNRADCSVKNCNIKGLRHSLTSLVVYETGQFEVMSKVLGHSKTSVTLDFYSHHNVEQARESIDILHIKKEGE